MTLALDGLVLLLALGEESVDELVDRPARNWVLDVWGLSDGDGLELEGVGQNLLGKLASVQLPKADQTVVLGAAFSAAVLAW